MRGLVIAGSFLTRLPLPNLVRSPADLARAIPWFPVVGAGVGVVVGAVRLAGDGVWSPWLAASVAVAAGLLVTGAFHEDGLADVADGVGGGDDPERRRAIMKDSRLGTYGAAALIVTMIIRVGAIAELDGDFVVSLAAVHALSRGAAALAMGRGVGSGGLADSYLIGLKPWYPLTAFVTGSVLAVALVGDRAWGLVAIGVVTPVVVGWWARRRLGVIGGDVLGTIQQIAELGGLMWLAAG